MNINKFVLYFELACIIPMISDNVLAADNKSDSLFDAVKSNGKSPISLAIENRNIDTLMSLIQNGVSKKETSEIRSILDSAVERGDLPTVKRLVEGLKNSRIADNVFECGTKEWLYPEYNIVIAKRKLEKMA